MKVLSIKQPWAWLICAGYKDIENRNWKIGRKSQHGPYSSYHQADFQLELPCRIYVHAGKQGDFTGDTLTMLEGAAGLTQEQLIQLKKALIPAQFGAIIGEVDITACVTNSKSPWFTGPYGFVLANPVLYDKPIPYRGQLGFFEFTPTERPAEE